MTQDLKRKGEAALAASARAFTKAQIKGHVWIGDQGCFETYEMLDTWCPPDPIHPDQLRLDDTI